MRGLTDAEYGILRDMMAGGADEDIDTTEGDAAIIDTMIAHGRASIRCGSNLSRRPNIQHNMTILSAVFAAVAFALLATNLAFAVLTWDHVRRLKRRRDEVPADERPTMVFRKLG